MIKKTILLGEDDQNVSSMYKTAFEKDGFDVICAFDGEDVIMKAKESRPDIVLLDINMPKKDGFEVLKEATEDLVLYNTLAETPIVMLTNYDNQQDIDYCYKMGAQDYIVKSEWTPAQVIKMIKKHLKMS